MEQKKIPTIPSWLELMKNCIQNHYRDYDQYFLRDYVYPLIKDYSMIHASFHKYEGDKCLNFPIDFDNEFHFVGEYVFENENRPWDNICQLREGLGR